MTLERPKRTRFHVKRIQTNIIALAERRLLTWLCARQPAWVTSDGLTLLGVLGALLVFASDVASRWHPAFLWLASLGLVIHWYGDSLDGSLARFRHLERPIYGYFLDHTVDAICNLCIMAGMGLTLDVRMDAALFALIGYYLLCMYVFINNHVTGVFQLSFLAMGPTELRLCLIAINTGMIVAGRVGTTIGGDFFSLYDLVLIGAGTIFVGLFLRSMIAGIRTLRTAENAPVSDDPAQSASMNVSSLAK